MEETNQINMGEDTKPMWMKIIIYIIVALIVVGLIYFFVVDMKKGGGNVSENTSEEVLNNNVNQNTMQTQETVSYIQGMKVEIIKSGTGEGAKIKDKVTVNYTGTLENGKKFDSSLGADRGPFQFTLGLNSVIQGWELGILGMKVGEKRKLTIPAELGYGASGAGSVIPPNATLIFEVDLLKIN